MRRVRHRLTVSLASSSASTTATGVSLNAPPSLKAAPVASPYMEIIMSEFRCIVSADLFRRAHVATSKEETRYYLKGVFIEPCPQGGALLTATDGYTLINVRDPRGFVEGSAIVTLNKGLMRELTGRKADLPNMSLRGMPERVLMVQGGEDDEFAYIAQSSLPYTEGGIQIEPRDQLHDLFDKPDGRVFAAQFGYVRIDGQFPEWRRVVPNGELGPVKSAFDAAKIKALGEALCTERAHHLAFASGSEDGAPCLVKAHYSDIEGFGVLMPVRADAATLPDYMAESPKAA